MAQTTINNGDTGLVIRTALNSMFTELYGLSDDPQYFVFGNAGTYGRIGIRGGNVVIDKTDTALGFAGIEDTDWHNITEQ